METKYVKYDDFISRMAEVSGYPRYRIKDVFHYIEEVACEFLAQSTEDTEVEVQVTPTIRITNYYRKPMNRVNPNTLEHFVVPGKFCTMAKVYGKLKSLGLNKDLYQD